MSGTVAGGKKAAAANLAKDPLFYAKIGAKGGRNGNTGGFGSHLVCEGICGLDSRFGVGHLISQCAGYKGGLKSRRLSKERSAN